MKGRWVYDLILRVSENSITLKEACRFALARILPKPTDFTLENIQFKKSDHIAWSIAWEIFLSRRYCPKGFEINKNDVIIDIGAHRGIFTAYAANRTNAKIISIEPNPENYFLLCKLRDENHWQQVHPIQGAVSNNSGTIKLFQSNHNSRHSTIGIDPVSLEELGVSIDVSAYTLKDILQMVTKVDLLKMDCEGSEYEILLNSGDQLTKVNRISMEIHFQTPNADPEGLRLFLSNKYKNVRIEKENQSLGYLFASTE